MKKLFLLAGLASVISVSVYAQTTLSPDIDAGSVECPTGCYGGNLVCCVTKGGSTYFTRG